MGKCISKAELIKEVADRAGKPIGETNKIVDALIQTIKDELNERNEVRLSGLCRFYTIKRSACTCRNPKTGNLITIPDHLAAKCKVNYKSFLC